MESIPEEKKSEIKRRLSQRSLRNSQASVPVQTSQQSPVEKLPAKKLQMFRQTSFVQPGDTRPKSMSHAIRWFKEYEIPKGVGKDKDGCISLWFHGEERFDDDKNNYLKHILQEPLTNQLLKAY